MPRKKNLIIGLLVFILAIGIFLAFVSRGSEKIQDADLALPTLETNETANGFYLLAKAADKLYWPKNQNDTIENLINTNGWDEDLFSSLLTSNAAVLPLLEEAISLQNIQIPLSLIDAGNTDILHTFRIITRLRIIQSKQALQRGDWMTATNTLADIIDFGEKLQRGHPPLLLYMVGSAIKLSALSQTEHMASHPEATIERIQDLIALADHYPMDIAALTNAWKADYQKVKRSIENTTVAAGNTTGNSNQFANSLTFKQARTINALADGARECLSNLAKYKTKASYPYMTTEIKQRNVVSAFLRGNVEGEALNKTTFSYWLTLQNGKYLLNNNLVAIRITLALRCHQLEHGSLPTSLGELVPKYLPQAPLDDFDGQPFRYLPARKLIYSIGDNLHDDGGADLDSKGKRLDQIFQIPF